MQFTNDSAQDCDENAPHGDTNGGDDKIDRDTAFVCYSANDASVISGTLKRLAEKEKKDEDFSFVPTLIELDNTEPCDAAQLLIKDGVVRINEVLSSELSDSCLDEINRALDIDENDADSGFGNVLCREHRYDKYLRDDGVFHKPLCSLFANGTPLGDMFSELFEGSPSNFHEFSALISDPGSASQPIHPDSVYDKPIVSLYTCFIALQDIDETMGPTIFLPRTNTETSHKDYKDVSRKKEFLASHEYRTALLKKGDVAIMDSRTLHFGSANTSGTVTDARRRVLLYVTLRNPLYSEKNDDFPPGGSKWADLNLSTSDFQQ